MESQSMLSERSRVWFPTYNHLRSLCLNHNNSSRSSHMNCQQTNVIFQPEKPTKTKRQWPYNQTDFFTNYRISIKKNEQIQCWMLGSDLWGDVLGERMEDSASAWTLGTTCTWPMTHWPLERFSHKLQFTRNNGGRDGGSSTCLDPWNCLYLPTLWTGCIFLPLVGHTRHFHILFNQAVLGLDLFSEHLKISHFTTYKAYR